MPIGRPDWYKTGRSQNIATMSDMGELAARLGSAVNYDRTGKLIIAHDFSYLCGLWTESHNGGPFVPALDTAYSNENGSTLKVSVNGGVANYCQFVRNVRAWNSSLLSLEVNILAKPYVADFRILLDYTQYGERYYAGIGWDESAKQLQYRYSFAGFNPLATVTHSIINSTFFTTLKLDIDLSLFEYKRLRYNSEVIDMTGVALPHAATTTTNVLNYGFRVYGAAAGIADWYFDHILITEDE